MSSALEGWRANKDVTWPGLVISDRKFTGCGVSTFEYPATATGTRVSISEAAGSLWESLRDNQLIGPGKLLIFVCHSMGGLVVRKMLVKEQHKISAAGISLVGLFLVASPTMGSAWGKFFLPLSQFVRNKQAIALAKDETNEWLRDLRQEFLELCQGGGFGILGKELAEDTPIYFKHIFFIPAVVQMDEAGILFSAARRIGGTNHFTIAKPATLEAEQQVILRNFLDDFNKRASESCALIPAGASFAIAAKTLATSMELQVDLCQFTRAELDARAPSPCQVHGHTPERTLVDLLRAFPTEAIRPYEVTIQGFKAALRPLS